MDDIDSMLSDISNTVFGNKHSEHDYGFNNVHEFLPNEVLFAVLMAEDVIQVIITPKPYFDEHHSLYDGHIHIPVLENIMAPDAESYWSCLVDSPESKLGMAELRSRLLELGFVEFPNASTLVANFMAWEINSYDHLTGTVFKPEEFLFCVRGRNAVLFTPKAFFEENGYLFDDGMEIPGKPEWDLRGATEDIYSYSKDFTPEQFTQALLDAGFQQDPKMDAIVDEGTDPEFFNDCSH